MKRTPILAAALLLAACAPKPGSEAPGEPQRVAEELPAPPAPDHCPDRLPAPPLLPGVEPEHTALDYWLTQLADDVDLDEVVLDRTGVDALVASYRHPDNPPIARSELSVDPSVEDVLRELGERLDWLRAKVDAGDYVDADGAPIAAELRAALAPRATIALAPRRHRLPGDVQVRCAPFAEPLYTPTLDLRFDRNNCSMLRAGEPVLVVAADAGMLFVRGTYTAGWIPADTELGPQVPAEQLARRAAERPALTRRAVLTRAFELLGTPYGWGGEGGGRDCSRFLMDVFEPFGVELPRFSASQSLAGSFAIDVSQLGSESERLLMMDAAARRGLVLLHFPNHIMLYLGRDAQGRAMAIHSFAEYLAPCQTPDPGEPGEGTTETLFEVDRVTVSDLELGRGTSRTAFVERITRITVIGGAPGLELQGVAERRLAAPIGVDETTGCPGDDDVFLIVAPRVPNADQPLRVIATATRDFGSVEIAFVGPDGQRHTPPVQRLGGPPYAVVAQLDAPAVGSWSVAMGEGGRVLECESVRVAARRPEPGVGSGPVWDVRHNWSEGYENLYATFVESLFAYPIDDDRTWTSLHDLTRDPEHNLLYDYYGEREDVSLTLEPDCADLPYMLRAYFAWKMGLPFGYRSCSRGRAGRPPQCNNLQTNLQPRASAGNVDAFQYFSRRNVRSGVHSASGRTHPGDDETDFYPIPLRRDTLLPGTLYADPYGHLLIVVGWQDQGTDRYGILIGADGQPDGTVGRRRFWRGSFLFLPETTDVGAGFKAYRPIRYSRSDGAMVSYTNDMLGPGGEFAPYSTEQYEGTVDDFYARMEAIINPRPLDPIAMLNTLVDALEESALRRVNSVDNGEAYMAPRGFAEIEMPTGYALFETSGAWEDFSTPSRDMRLLISIDTVRLFPERVRSTPERYGLDPAVADVEAAVAEVQGALDAELRTRSFTYTRTDGSAWTLTLADLVDRASEFEVAYNPNDCPEIRWGAREGTDEYTTCRRHAPPHQRQRMAQYRSWFAERQRPPR